MVRNTLTRLVLPVVLALLSSAAFAQINCDQTTHIDTNGNYCTVLVTSGSRYDVGTGDTTYPEVSEDGQPFPSNFNAAVFVEYWADAGLPFDPLKLSGGPLANPYGYVTTDLISNPSQGVFGESTVNAPKPPVNVGDLAWTSTFTVGDLYDSTSEGNSSYPYTWAGTFVVNFRCLRKGGRYNRCINGAAEGLMVLEATSGSHASVHSFYKCGSDKHACFYEAKVDGPITCPRALPNCKP